MKSWVEWGVPGPSGRPVRRRRVAGIYQPVSLRNCAAWGRTGREESDTEREEPVRGASWAHVPTAARQVVIGVAPPTGHGDARPPQASHRRVTGQRRLHGRSDRPAMSPVNSPLNRPCTPRTRGEKKDGSEDISGEPAPSARPAGRRRIDDMDPPVSLEKLHGMGGYHRRSDRPIPGSGHRGWRQRAGRRLGRHHRECHGQKRHLRRHHRCADFPKDEGRPEPDPTHAGRDCLGYRRPSSAGL